jgi:hypothetical protein
LPIIDERNSCIALTPLKEKIAVLEAQKAQKKSEAYPRISF